MKSAKSRLVGLVSISPAIDKSRMDVQFFDVEEVGDAFTQRKSSCRHRVRYCTRNYLVKSNQRTHGSFTFGEIITNEFKMF